MQALADSINEHADLIGSGTVLARFAGLIATCLTTSRQFFDADNNWSHIEKILATGTFCSAKPSVSHKPRQVPMASTYSTSTLWLPPRGLRYCDQASARAYAEQAVLETLHDAEGLVAMWGSAINQLKDDFAVLAAVGEDEDQRGYLTCVPPRPLWAHVDATREMITTRTLLNH